MRLLLPTYTLLKREIVLFYRQKNRVIGALLQPLIFWLLIGSGMNASFSPSSFDDMSYIEFFFPGILLMIVLFTSIFSTISIIEDRKEGFLQGVLIAPVPRSGIVLGKVLGGTALGVFQALLFLLLLLTPLMSMKLTVSDFFALISILFFMGFGLTSLGTVIAWGMDSVQGYHAIMSVVLFPLWIFSGAVFPVEGTPAWLDWTMTLNPLTHGLALMRNSFDLGADLLPETTQSVVISTTYVIGFCFVNFMVAVWLVGRGK